MQTYLQKFTSRKFLLAAIAGAILFVDAIFEIGLDPEQRIALASTVVAFIAGETVLDKKGMEINADFAKQVAKAQLIALYEQMAQANPEAFQADPNVVVNYQEASPTGHDSLAYDPASADNEPTPN